MVLCHNINISDKVYVIFSSGLPLGVIYWSVITLFCNTPQQYFEINSPSSNKALCLCLLVFPLSMLSRPRILLRLLSFFVAFYTPSFDTSCHTRYTFRLAQRNRDSSEVNLRPNLRPTTLFSRSGKIILAKLYLLKWLGCILGRRLGHRL